MTSLDAKLADRLEAIRQQNLFRELRRVDSPQGARLTIDGRTLLNFSSNDYLGLANHPSLKAAAIAAIEQFGVGAGSSRLVCGSSVAFHELEETLAAFKGTEAALTFSTGYAAALGTITALVGKGDIIVLDKLVHASIVDAARLCGAKVRVFAHNDLGALEHILKWAIALPGEGLARNVLIVTESVFSMDGDAAPLREIVELKNKYGAWLMVDEAHATGLYGKHRRGLAEEFGVSDQIDVQMGTLGKAIGASGGYICGSRKLIDLLINRARSFIFSTAPLPAASAAATAGVRLIQSAEGERQNQKLWANVAQFRSAIGNPAAMIPSAIVPVIIGDEAKAVEVAAQLSERNIFVPAIRYPTVARGKARLRITFSAAHSTADISELAGALKPLIHE